MVPKLVSIMGLVSVVADEVVEDVVGSSAIVDGASEQDSGLIVKAPLPSVETKGCSLAAKILRNGVVPVYISNIWIENIEDKLLSWIINISRYSGGCYKKVRPNSPAASSTYVTEVAKSIIESLPSKE